MIEIRWLFSVCVIILLLLSQSLSISAHEGVSIPLSRVPSQPMKEGKEVGGDNFSSLHTGKLRIHIKRRGGAGRVIPGGRGKTSSAIRTLPVSQFHACSFAGYFIFLAFFLL
ncbi:hypothetical protein L1049_022302 [Liquidambar formosana]|uniref:Transmembrane protein n=1 Tax=Liquidambar formosana TaxID=63359 RepID=A0AAP0RC89_LIQFO